MTKHHVWYFGDDDKIAIVEDETHWYWDWFCTCPRHVIYLGEL